MVTGADEVTADAEDSPVNKNGEKIVLLNICICMTYMLYCLV